MAKCRMLIHHRHPFFVHSQTVVHAWLPNKLIQISPTTTQGPQGPSLAGFLYHHESMNFPIAVGPNFEKVLLQNMVTIPMFVASSALWDHLESSHIPSWNAHIPSFFEVKLPHFNPEKIPNVCSWCKNPHLSQFISPNVAGKLPPTHIKPSQSISDSNYRYSYRHKV